MLAWKKCTGIKIFCLLYDQDFQFMTFKCSIHGRGVKLTQWAKMKNLEQVEDCTGSSMLIKNFLKWPNFTYWNWN